MDTIMRGYAKGSYGTDELLGRMADHLASRHGRAAYLGRQRAGDTSAYDEDDARMGLVAAENEEEPLAHFMADLDADWGRDENGELQVNRLLNRGRFYVAKLDATSNESFTLAGQDADMYHWRLGLTERHCPDCPVHARNGPYLEHNIPTFPRRCDTECLFRCSCHLQRVRDSKDCFAPSRILN